MSVETIDQALFFYTETSLNAGAGSSVSAVDLPIQRERVTGYPLVQGSGVKGALRSQATLASDKLIAVFGPETDNADAHAGAVSVGDARIVLFPVRSLSGVFAYATSSLALSRLMRLVSLPRLPAAPTSPAALITTISDLEQRGRIVLEEFSFTGQKSPDLDTVAAWLAKNAFPQTDAYQYWREKVQRSLIVLPDDDFRDFVLHSTEITTHVKLLEASKTVKEGALWTREAIPSDALFVVPVVARKSRNGTAMSAQDIQKTLHGAYGSGRIQLGGDETTGQGIIALHWA